MPPQKTPTLNKQVDAVIRDWPDRARMRCLEARAIIYDVAKASGAAPLVETLKWGQPSWLPAQKGIGTTLRVWWSETTPLNLSFFVNCQTDLIAQFKDIYPETFTYSKNRGFSIRLDAPFPKDAFAHCAILTLGYHRNKT